MPWIESHDSIGDHPKTLKFASTLGIDVPSAVGHLHLLWHWALRFAENGDLSDYDDGEIALAARWNGDASSFVKALESCGPGQQPGFLNADYTLHNWWTYAGKLLERREKDRERKRQSRGRPQDVQRTSDGHPAPVRTSHADVRAYRTEPYRTPPDQQQLQVGEGSGEREANQKPRRLPIPDNFKPSKRAYEIAEECNVDIKAAEEDWRDWAAATGTRYVSPNHAFCRWLRTTAPRRVARIALPPEWSATLHATQPRWLARRVADHLGIDVTATELADAYRQVVRGLHVGVDDRDVQDQISTDLLIELAERVGDLRVDEATRGELQRLPALHGGVQVLDRLIRALGAGAGQGKWADKPGSLGRYVAAMFDDRKGGRRG